MSVFKRAGSPNYYMDFIIDGHRVAKSTRKKTRREALQVEARTKQELIDSMQGSAPVRCGGYPYLTDALERWYSERGCLLSSGATLHGILRRITLAVGDEPLDKIDSEWMGRAFAHLNDRGHSPKTVNTYMEGLSTVLRRAREVWGMAELVPPKYDKFRIPKKQRFTAYSKEDEARILSLLEQGLKRRNDKDVQRDVAAMFAVAIDTGLRKGELEQLVFDDYVVDLDERILNLDPKKMALKTQEYRIVPLTARAWGLLKELRKRYPSAPFQHFSPNVSYRILKHALHDLGLDTERGIGWHTCRHTCCSRLVQAGVDLETVREWAGHSSIAMTQRYLQTSKALLKGAVDALSASGEAHAHLKMVGAGEARE